MGQQSDIQDALGDVHEDDVGSDDGGVQIVKATDIFGEDDDVSVPLTEEQLLVIYGDNTGATTTTAPATTENDCRTLQEAGVPTVITGQVGQNTNLSSHRSISSTSHSMYEENNSVSCGSTKSKKDQAVDMVEKAETWARTLLFQKCKLAGPDEFGMFGEIAEKCMIKYKVNMADARAMELYWSTVSWPIQKSLGLRRNNVSCQLSKQLKGKSVRSY